MKYTVLLVSLVIFLLFVDSGYSRRANLGKNRNKNKNIVKRDDATDTTVAPTTFQTTIATTIATTSEPDTSEADKAAEEKAAADKAAADKAAADKAAADKAAADKAAADAAAAAAASDDVETSPEDYGAGGGDGELSEEEVAAEENLTVEMEDCSTADVMDRYNCSTIPAPVFDYFGGDLSTTSILKRLYADSIIKDLGKCPKGSWCLPYTEHMKIKKNLPAFYMQGPFCSNAMQCSLDRMLSARFHCQESALVFLVNSVALLCDLKRSEDFYHVPTCGDNEECYARTKEAMYVLYQDVVHPDKKRKDKMHAEDCNDFKEQMAITYTCADKCCQFAQQEILKRFEMWDGLADDAEDIYYDCNITAKCMVDQYMEKERQQQEEQQELIDEEMDAMEGVMQEVENMTEALAENNLYDNFGEFGGMEMPSNDHTIVYVIVTMSIMMVMSLMFILFVAFRKYRQGKGYDQFFKRGYSELTEEETRMLKNEYN